MFTLREIEKAKTQPGESLHQTRSDVILLINNAIASLAVKNLAAAMAWYEALFERTADSTPMSELAEWRFPHGGWLQIYQLPERAGTGSATLAVSDLNAVVAHAKNLGIDTSQTRSNAMVKTLMIVDLDGNHLAFAEAKDPNIAQ